MGYLKATLVATETEDGQKVWDCASSLAPRAMWVLFGAPLFVLRVGNIQVWRGEGSGGQAEVCRQIRASWSGGKVL